jgi:hypothetical protein
MQELQQQQGPLFFPFMVRSIDKQHKQGPNKGHAAAAKARQANNGRKGQRHNNNAARA